MENMATKAERFRYEVERASGSTAAAKKKKRAAAAGMRGPSLARKATVAFEETPAKVPPSRKSTRKSKHRQKAATPLTGKTLLSKSTPHNRHDVGRPGPRVAR
jgi:hypothetical protein